MIAEVQAASKGRSDNPGGVPALPAGPVLPRPAQPGRDRTCGRAATSRRCGSTPTTRSPGRGSRARPRTSPARTGFRASDGYEVARTAGAEGGHARADAPRGAHRARLGAGMVRLELEGARDFLRARAGARARQHARDQSAPRTFFGNRGNLDEAVALFRRAVGLDPLNVPVNRNLGLYCLRRRRAAGGRGRADPDAAPQRAKRDDVLLAQLRAARARAARRSARRRAEGSQPDLQARGTAIVHHARGDVAASDAALDALIQRIRRRQPPTRSPRSTARAARPTRRSSGSRRRTPTATRASRT